MKKIWILLLMVFLSCAVTSRVQEGKGNGSWN